MKSEGEGGEEEEEEDAPLTNEKKIISNEEEENGITEDYISIPAIKVSTLYPMFISF
ncbi:MAG TPA: hypothetical protein VE622_04320 [Nitrososphaeraceae archaeon]|jgi:hypothetical protein|nr:hypothetical protein [Nitrososphaeraceae archaeon]